MAIPKSTSQGTSEIIYEESDGVYNIDSEVVREHGPSMCLVIAVAEISGADPMKQPPLNDVVDPEALDDLFDGVSRTDGSDLDQVSLSYAGYRVTLYGDDGMVIQPSEPSPATSHASSD